MDNFFTSLDFFQKLAEKDTYACETIRKNRGKLPESFTKEKLD